jgi:hypothetical protein
VVLSNLPRYQEGGSSYYPHGTPGPSHGAETSASTEFPHWYYPSRGISVTGWTKQNVWWKGSDRSRAVWMSLSACRRRYTRPSTHRPVCYTASSTTLASTLMLKSYKDLSLRRDWSTSYGQSFSSRFIPSFSNYPLQVSLSVIITSCMYPSLSLLLV